MENNVNAHCTICGKGYHVCQSCLNIKTFKPWRTVTDTIEHYKIYLAIHKYTLSKNKDKAKEELKECNLSGLNSFVPEIKNIINEIMEDKQKIQTKSVQKKINASSLKETIEMKNKKTNEVL